MSPCRQIILSCDRIALYRRLDAPLWDTSEIDGGIAKSRIYIRVASKYFPVVREKIPVNVTREFSSERPVNTGLDHPAALRKGRNSRICPVNSRNTHFRGGDRFVYDCAHHHPVFPNRGNGRRSQRGRFCGDLAAYFQRSRSLPRITVSRVDFWLPVSATKNSVPRD